MVRFVLLLVALTLAGTVSACGDDRAGGARDGAPAHRVAAHLDPDEARSVLERGGLRLAPPAAGEHAAIAREIDVPLDGSARLRTRGGRAFDLLAFRSAADARSAWEGLLDSRTIARGGAAVRAVNVLVVLPHAGDGLSEKVTRRLREVAVACDPRTQATAHNADLRRACFRGSEAGPAGAESTDTDELAPAGATVRVGGVQYRVTASRIADRDGAPGTARLRVSLRACNTSELLAVPTEHLRVVGASSRPIEPDARAGTYAPDRLQRGECLPAHNHGAAALQFALPEQASAGRPLGLEIVSEDGAQRATVLLDV